jgi:hypothetical protein
LKRKCFHSPFIQFKHSEPNDLDTIYKVLKKAGEISAASEKNQASGGNQPNMEIPVVNIPDYPDRTPRRGPLKISGPSTQQPRQGLTAPTTDMLTSSGPKFSKFQSLSPDFYCLYLFMIKNQK